MKKLLIIILLFIFPLLLACDNKAQLTDFIDTTQISTVESTIPTPNLISIQIQNEPTKKEYYLEEQIDLTGLEVKAYYSDSTELIIDINDIAYSGYDSSTEGLQTVIISYLGKTDSFSVKVEKQVQYVTLTDTQSFLDNFDITYEVILNSDNEIENPFNVQVQMTITKKTEFTLVGSYQCSVIIYPSLIGQYYDSRDAMEYIFTVFDLSEPIVYNLNGFNSLQWLFWNNYRDNLINAYDDLVKFYNLNMRLS